ncbi:MAG: hypothetical protein DI587_38210, partial [Variovorax paradoxus]
MSRTRPPAPAPGLSKTWLGARRRARGDQRGVDQHGAKLLNTVANADVPKFTLIVGAAYGAAYYALCGRAFKPNAL